jgi:hypothetical protein
VRLSPAAYALMADLVSPSGLKPNSLTRGRPPQPPRPLLPRPKPRWRRGAKRLSRFVISEYQCDLAVVGVDDDDVKLRSMH